jgi:hypothetical protein
MKAKVKHISTNAILIMLGNGQVKLSISYKKKPLEMTIKVVKIQFFNN